MPGCENVAWSCGDKLVSAIAGNCSFQDCDGKVGEGSAKTSGQSASGCTSSYDEDVCLRGRGIGEGWREEIEEVQKGEEEVGHFFHGLLVPVLLAVVELRWAVIRMTGGVAGSVKGKSWSKLHGVWCDYIHV